MKERFPELGYLFGCYFHQDWDIEGSDWQGVVRSFLKHETPETVKAATTQLGAFLSLNLDDDRLHEALLDMGCAYYPGPEKSDRDWLHEVHDFLRRAVRPPPEPG